MEKQFQTLESFVNGNQPLLSALGIFGGLAVFSVGLEYRLLGSMISFIFFAAMILVWFEIRKKFEKDSSFSCMLFHELFRIGFWAMLFYWLIAFRPIWNVALVFPLSLLIIYSIAKFAKKYIKGWTKFTKILFVVFAIVLSMAIANRLAPPLNTFFNTASALLKN